MPEILRKMLNGCIYCIVGFCFFLILSGRISFSSFLSGESAAKFRFFKPIIDSLLKRHVDTAFLYKLIADPRIEFNEKFIKINVTGFLTKPDYSNAYNRFAVDKCRKFMNEFDETLDKCEDLYKIDREIIIAILWVETKLGNYLGENCIASVFLSTAMASQPQFINLNRRILREEFHGDSAELNRLMDKISDRAFKKSSWSINELMSMYKMDMKSIDIIDLKGSWAGAFGIPQFLPSSYLKWAADGNGDGKIDIFDEEDAIFSIANFLKNNGWGDSPDEQRKAVFNYNNSYDYVDAVFILASKLKKKIAEKGLPDFENIQ
jgi:membrane-bound lytic murein transglycosylase B